MTAAIHSLADARRAKAAKKPAKRKQPSAAEVRRWQRENKVRA